jgi:hypothetical protein
MTQRTDWSYGVHHGEPRRGGRSDRRRDPTRAFGGSIVAQLVFSRLEHHHPEEWERLGRPSLPRVSGGKSLELMRFVLTRRYAKLGDRRLNTLVALSLAISIGIVAQMLVVGFCS